MKQIRTLHGLILAAHSGRSVRFVYAGKEYTLPAAFVQNWPGIRIHHALLKGMTLYPRKKVTA